MSIFQAITELEQRGEGGVLCTIIASQGSTPRHEGSRMLVRPDGSIAGSVGGGEMESRVIAEALAALADGKSRRLHYSMVDPKEGDPGICGGTVEIYVEPLLRKARLLIVGGGHVGKATAHLAKWLGFRVAISDDRPEFCNREAIPDADEFFVGKLIDLPSLTELSADTYVVLTTRGAPIDVPGLPALLQSNVAYLGVIGSRKRWLTTKRALLDQGVSEEVLARVYSPVGLELGAESPEEIAVSIMAEILMLKNRASGKPMQYRG